MPDSDLPIVTVTNQPDFARIIAPVFALVLLSFVVLAVLGTLRLQAIRNRTYPRGDFRSFDKPAGTQLPRAPEAAARNFLNLFELPVLFYALVPLLCFTVSRSSRPSSARARSPRALTPVTSSASCAMSRSNVKVSSLRTRCCACDGRLATLPSSV